MLAIIGGSGLSQLPGLADRSRKKIDTKYGSPSAELIAGLFHGLRIVFLARHGENHSIPPHQINYRANISALKTVGVTQIVSVAAVGGITSRLLPATIAFPDQLIDYTYDRKQTFFDEPGDSVTHIDFTEPYTQTLVERLHRAAKSAGLNVRMGGTYGCTQGPRLETAAEIQRMEHDGCDMVGMTGMPEAALAREAGLDYACCAVVANWAAGKSSATITMQEIEKNLSAGMENVGQILEKFASGPNGN